MRRDHAVAAPRLDDSQRRVVEHPGGPLLVLAGPGTGKTTTLVEAVVDRIERRGLSPEQVLVLTFSRKAAEILGPSFDLEVVEMHHRMKKDAPSGTAKMLAETLAEVRNLQYNEDVRHGRFGDVGARTQAEIGMHAVRGGDVVGDHTVIFAALGERVELTHKASSREIFARGALRAVLWAHGKPGRRGLVDMSSRQASEPEDLSSTRCVVEASRRIVS